MDTNSEYSVYILSKNQTINQVASFLLSLTFFIFCISVLIEPFIKLIKKTYNVEDIGVMIGLLLLVGGLSFLSLFIKNSKAGKLKIKEEKVEIESTNDLKTIYFKDLKRISFIISMFAIRPYRIEFIYPDFQLIQLRIKSKEDFKEILDGLYEITPEELEKQIFNFESMEK